MQNQSSHTQNIQAPLVSFIITTYNMPTEYLEECIKSILQLSLNAKEREIILVDDGNANLYNHYGNQYGDSLES